MATKPTGLPLFRHRRVAGLGLRALIAAGAVGALLALSQSSPSVDAQTPPPVAFVGCNTTHNGNCVYHVTEGQTPAGFSLLRSSSDKSSVSVDYKIVAGLSGSNAPTWDAAEEDDFAAPSGGSLMGTLTIAAGSAGDQGQTLSVNILDDDAGSNDVSLYERHEGFTIELTGTHNSVNFGPVYAYVRIEEEPRILSPPASFTVTEDNPTLVFTLDGPLLYPWPVECKLGFNQSYATATIEAGVGGDSSQVDVRRENCDQTIAAGSTSVTFTLPVVDDGRPEPNETVSFRFGGRRSTSQGPRYPAPVLTSGAQSVLTWVVTIEDDDMPFVGQRYVYLRTQDEKTRAELQEGQSVTVFAEIVGEAPSTDVEIPLKFIEFPSDEVMSGDYSMDNTISIESGKKMGTATLTINTDLKDERHHELLAVEIVQTEGDKSLPTGYVIGDRNRLEVIIKDIDPTPVTLKDLAPNPATLTEASGGTARATFTVEMERVPKGEPPGEKPFNVLRGLDEGNVVFAFADGGDDPKAAIGKDYTVTVNTSGCESSNGKYSCTVTVEVIDDDLYEGAIENGTIRLDRQNSTFDTNGDGGGLSSSDSYPFTIADDDPQPVLSISDATVTEGGNLSFTITRTGAMENKLRVRFKTGDDTSEGANQAVAGEDYTAKNTVVTIPKNSGSVSVTVDVKDDRIDEDTETMSVTLSEAVDVTPGRKLPVPLIDDDSAIGTINDDDTRGITVSETSLALEEASNVGIDPRRKDVGTYTVVLMSQPTGTVTVTITNPDGSPVTLDKTTLTFPPSDWNSPQTVRVTVEGDDIDNPMDKRSATITHAVTSSGNDYDGESVGSVSVEVADNDTRGVKVSETSLTLAEVDKTETTEQENVDSYSVVLLSEPTGTVTVSISNPDGSPVMLNHSVLTFTPAVWHVAQIVAVTAVDDDVDNLMDKRSATITHEVTSSGNDYDGESVAGVGVEVADDDDEPMISIDGPSVEEEDTSTVR